VGEPDDAASNFEKADKWLYAVPIADRTLLAS
jgi:hypothetical protein